MVLIKPFNSLTPHELYEMLKLRSEVFVVEQNCVFQDMDDKDQHCHHLMIWNGDKLAAYARLVPPGISYPEMSIGRVVSSPAARRAGEGKKLMNAAIDNCYQLFGKGPIKIGAQLYLKKFYESFGFTVTGPVYLEDGIDHVEMMKLN
jgi:ElaA protein